MITVPEEINVGGVNKAVSAICTGYHEYIDEEGIKYEENCFLFYNIYVGA